MTFPFTGADIISFDSRSLHCALVEAVCDGLFKHLYADYLTAGFIVLHLMFQTIIFFIIGVLFSKYIFLLI